MVNASLAVQHDAQWDFYGRRLATCSSDGTTRIFDVAGGVRKMEAELRGHDGPVWQVRTCRSRARAILEASPTTTAEVPQYPPCVRPQVSWAHPRFGNIIATCGFDHKVIMWKEASKGVWQKFYETEHKASVNSVAFGPLEYGLCLASASSDGFVSVSTYTPLESIGKSHRGFA